MAGQPYHVLISFVEDLPLVEAPAAPVPSAPAPAPVATKEAAPAPVATREVAPLAPPVANHNEEAPAPLRAVSEVKAPPPPPETPRPPPPIPRWAPWVPAGVALVGAILAASEGGTATQCDAPVTTAAGLYQSQACVVNHATAANVAWGIAGAGAVTAGVLWLVQWRRAATHEAPPVQVDASQQGVRLSGRF